MPELIFLFQNITQGRKGGKGRRGGGGGGGRSRSMTRTIDITGVHICQNVLITFITCAYDCVTLAMCLLDSKHIQGTVR